MFVKQPRLHSIWYVPTLLIQCVQQAAECKQSVTGHSVLFGSRKKLNLQISYFLPQQQSQANPRVQADPRVQAPRSFTKPPLLKESRLTGGGSPNLVALVEWNVPVERFMGATNSAH